MADFGVARVKAQTGVMTAETGTYRWMAPEVYNSLLNKDLRSLYFGVLLNVFSVIASNFKVLIPSAWGMRREGLYTDFVC